MKTEVSISERLKDLRVEKKLNLEELAELTGITNSALGERQMLPWHTKSTFIIYFQPLSFAVRCKFLPYFMRFSRLFNSIIITPVSSQNKA